MVFIEKVYCGGNLYVNENEFKFNIDNIKNDLAIEGMDISQNDIDMYKMYANNEITMPDLIEM